MTNQKRLIHKAVGTIHVIMKKGKQIFMSQACSIPLWRRVKEKM